MNDQLFKMAKQRAAEKGTTFTALVENGVRAILASPTVPDPIPAARLPTFRGRGLEPSVDLDSNSALLDLMEENQ